MNECMYICMYVCIYIYIDRERGRERERERERDPLGNSSGSLWMTTVSTDTRPSVGVCLRKSLGFHGFGFRGSLPTERRKDTLKLSLQQS